MNRSSTFAGLVSSELLVTIGTYLSFAAVMLFGLLLYKLSGQSYRSLWSERFRYSSAAVLIAIVTAVGLFAFAFRASASARRKRFWFPVVANALAVLICLAFGETTLRLAAGPDELGVRVGALTLVPYDWKAFSRRNLSLVERSRSNNSFYVEDKLLGWTIGPGREANDGMYKSSAEGLRSMYRGAKLNSQEAGHRVALFGDSFTFSADVPFEQSWGHFLEANIGAGTRVLNFGVDGYGIDQAYLRFKRDANEWPSEVAVLAFIQDDLYRNVALYPFFRVSWQRPFSKPRFILKDGSLKLLNVPTITPDAIFEKSSTRELPLLDYDGNFAPTAYAWESNPLYASFLVRFIATKFPRWTKVGAEVNDGMAVQLASRLIEEFVAAAQARQAQPIVVYLPARNDFAGSGPVLVEPLRKSLSLKNIELHDMTPCLSSRVSRAQLFIEEKPHYSGAGNAALAKCIQPLVAASLN